MAHHSHQAHEAPLARSHLGSLEAPAEKIKDEFSVSLIKYIPLKYTDNTVFKVRINDTDYCLLVRVPVLIL